MQNYEEENGKKNASSFSIHDNWQIIKIKNKECVESLEPYILKRYGIYKMLGCVCNANFIGAETRISENELKFRGILLGSVS